MTGLIHPTAIIAKGAKIAPTASIGPYCIIGEHVTLADKVVLKSHVVIDGHTTIGEGTIIYPFASLGTAPQDLKYAGEPSELIIGKNNTIREHVTMNPGTKDGGMKTTVGDNGLFMMSVHIAHDCVVGNNVIMANNATLAGHVHVGDHVIIGGLSAAHQFIRIGEHAIIGGMSGVESDVIPYGRVKGERAFLAGLNLIGLERRGFTKDDVRNLQRAFNQLFGEEGTLDQRIDQVEADFKNDETVTKIIEFAKKENTLPAMPAPEKSLKTLGILAGGGLLPQAVIEACIAQNIKPFIVAFKGSADPEILKSHDHIWSRVGAGGAIIKELKNRNINDLVFIGSLGRPNPLTMMPDMKTAKFLAAHSLKLGDNSLLTAIRKFLEKEGFKVHGAHQIAPDLLTPEGTLGAIESQNWDDIKLGLKLSQDLGHRDLGQSVIVKNGELIAEEGQNGTDALITHFGCEGAILVKTCKPQQDPDLDMPTIGPQTIQRCAEKKMHGVVAHAGKSLFIGRKEAIKLADENNMFIIGAKP